MVKAAKATDRRRWDSPIEIMLRNAICDYAQSSKLFTLWDSSTSAVPALLLHRGQGLCVVGPDGRDLSFGDSIQWGDGDSYAELYGAVRLDAYKIDLLLRAGGTVLAIECDGFDWHDRTKQQASSDRARDRFLLRNGVSCVRFTGSDIHARADECAAEIFSIFLTIRNRDKRLAPSEYETVDDYAVKAFHSGKSAGVDEGRRSISSMPDDAFAVIALCREAKLGFAFDRSGKIWVHQQSAPRPDPDLIALIREHRDALIPWVPTYYPRTKL